jgi:hypothetical protein
MCSLYVETVTPNVTLEVYRLYLERGGCLHRREGASLYTVGGYEAAEE